MKIKIIMLAISLLLLTSMAIGKQQITEAEAAIPLHSKEYKGVEITFYVEWEGDNIQPQMIKSGVEHYFLNNIEYYSGKPVEAFMTEKQSIENNVTQYLRDTFGKSGLTVNKTTIRDVRIYQRQDPQILQQRYEKCNPVVIYKETPNEPIEYAPVILIGIVIGMIIMFLIVMAFKKLSH